MPSTQHDGKASRPDYLAFPLVSHSVKSTLLLAAAQSPWWPLQSWVVVLTPLHEGAGAQDSSAALRQQWQQQQNCNAPDATLIVMCRGPLCQGSQRRRR